MSSHREGDGGFFGLALLMVCALGLVLRAVHLDIPMRYDETVTYVSYASKGWEHVTSNYQNPNNHVFHSLLVSWLTGWLGGAPFVIRLPAFVAGCTLIPFAAWVGYLAHSREAGLFAGVFVATSPILIEFSVNARGYTLMSLCVLLAIGIGMGIMRGRRWIAWLALIEVGVIGLYTLPTMAIPWLGITLWLAVGVYLRSSAIGARAYGLIPLVAANVAIGIVVLALYSGIISNQGLEAIVGNKFVAAQPLGTFLMGTPGAVADVLQHWGRGVPPVLAGLGLVSIGAGLAVRGGQREWVLILVALGVGASIMMLVTRNWGEPRIWLWVVPLLSITAGIGVVELGRRIAKRRHAGLGVAAGSVWAAAMSVHLLLAQPVRASLETGAFPEGEDVFSGIMERYRLGDGIVGDFVSVEPLRYYLRRWSETHEPPPRTALERIWIILNENDAGRAAEVRNRLARMGAPALEDSNPVFAIGNVVVYLYGRPAGSPDVRLLEAIDWHTGVAGHVDEERALALLFEVVEETASPLARMWMARCVSLGCMGYQPSESSASALAGEVIAEVRELALAGEIEAAFLMGAAHDEGVGEPVDPEQAVSWYRRAAEAGHVLGARRLGSAYSTGRGVARSDSAAVLWWRRAVDAGDATAQLRLGESYAAGRGVERDSAQAITWHTRAVERGNAQARDALELLSRRQSRR